MSDHPRFFVSSTVDRDRRHFLKTCGAVAGAAWLGNLTGCQHSAPPIDSISSQPSHLVQFGHTDLYVSRMCQGTAFRRHLSRGGDDTEAHKLIRYCLDIGVNFFDSAEAYGWGGSETALGKGLAERRGEAVIATKAAAATQSGEALVFTREVLTQKVEGSLQRLGTDYIDLYLLHGPDKKTPSTRKDTPPHDAPTQEHMAQIAAAMKALVQSGKIRYWGVSNHLPRQVDELIEIGKEGGTSPIACLEDYFNIVAADRRDFMVDQLFPLIRKGNLGLMAFSPLGEGRLVPGREPEEGSPLLNVIAALDEVANELGVSRPQVCVAWAAAHPEVTSVLAGGEKPEHVGDNFKGTQLALPDEAIQKLNAASDTYTAQVAEQQKESA